MGNGRSWKSRDLQQRYSLVDLLLRQLWHHQSADHTFCLWMSTVKVLVKYLTWAIYLDIVQYFKFRLLTFLGGHVDIIKFHFIPK